MKKKTNGNEGNGKKKKTKAYDYLIAETFTKVQDAYHNSSSKLSDLQGYLRDEFIPDLENLSDEVPKAVREFMASWKAADAKIRERETIARRAFRQQEDVLLARDMAIKGHRETITDLANLLGYLLDNAPDELPALIIYALMDICATKTKETQDSVISHWFLKIAERRNPESPEGPEPPEEPEDEK